jgi:hypothetical protein
MLDGPPGAKYVAHRLGNEEDRNQLSKAKGRHGDRYCSPQCKQQR